MTVRVPFGKHRGALLSNIPDGYLAWLVGKADGGAPDPGFLARNKNFFDEAGCEYQRRKDGKPLTSEVNGIPDELRGYLKEFINLGYKAMAIKYHPDKGGTDEEMIQIGQLRDYLKGL